MDKKERADEQTENADHGHRDCQVFEGDFCEHILEIELVGLGDDVACLLQGNARCGFEDDVDLVGVFKKKIDVVGLLFAERIRWDLELDVNADSAAGNQEIRMPRGDRALLGGIRMDVGELVPAKEGDELVMDLSLAFHVVGMSDFLLGAAGFSEALAILRIHDFQIFFRDDRMKVGHWVRMVCGQRF